MGHDAVIQRCPVRPVAPKERVPGFVAHATPLVTWATGMRFWFDSHEVVVVNPTQWRQFLSRVHDYVDAAQYPASKADIVRQAQRGNVPSDVLGMLLRLPDQTFASSAEVVQRVEAAGPPPEHVK